MSSFDPIADTAAEELRSVDESPPKERLKDAQSLRNIFGNEKKADDKGSHNRSIVQGGNDMEPPHDELERVDEGLEELFNINTGMQRLITDEAVSGVMDIFTANRYLCEIPLDPSIPAAQREAAQDIIEDEWTEMLRDWSPFHIRTNSLASTFTEDGIAVLFHDEESSWKFIPLGLSDVVFHRDAEPVAEENEIVIIQRKVSVGYLWKNMGNKGWNDEAIESAIKESAKSGSKEWNDFEKVREALKTNESYASSSIPQVEILYGLVAGYDGKVSFYICTKDGKENDFLYSEPNKYQDIGEVLQIFPYSSGRNRKLYSVRGLSYFIFPICNAYDIQFNRYMDAAHHDSMELFQSKADEELEDMVVMDIGPGRVLPPGTALAEHRQSRGLHQNLAPALNSLLDQASRLSGGLSNGPVHLGERANKENVSASLDQLNKMNAFAIGNFYPPLDKVYRNQIKRVFKSKLDTEESKAMKKRILDRGVPKEFLDRIVWSKVKAVRIEGNKATRLNNYEEMERKRGGMDAQGRRHFDHDHAAERMGRQKADRYFGPVEMTRTDYHAKIAVLENEQMLDGAEIDPFDGEDHVVHLRYHMEELLDVQDIVESGELSLEEYVQRYYPIWIHAQKTLALTIPDVTFEAELNEIKAQLQRLGEFFHNGIKKIQAQQNKEQEEQTQEGSGEQEVDLEMQSFLAEEQRKQAAWEAEEERKAQKHMAEIAMLDDKNSRNV